MRKLVRRATGVVVVAGVVTAALWASGLGPAGFGPGEPIEARASEGEPANELPRVELTEVEVGPLATYIEATANLVAEHAVSVVAETNGRVTKIGPEPGDTVERGAFLVALDAADARRQERTAALRLEAAKTTAKRTSTLAAKKLVSAEEHEKATHEVELATQELTDARAAVARARIRAPIAGELTKRTVEFGQYVRTGDPLFDITDFKTLVADIHVPERDAMLLEPGRTVEIVLQAKDDVKFEGTVRRIAPVVDTKSGTVEVRIEVAKAPASVRSGSFVAVRMIRQRHDAACLLVRDAVVVGPSGAYVFVVEDGVAHRRDVKLGDTERGRVHVLDGVAAGEAVVLAGHGALDDGDRIEVTARRGVG